MAFVGAVVLFDGGGWVLVLQLFSVGDSSDFIVVVLSFHFWFSHMAISLCT